MRIIGWLGVSESSLHSRRLIGTLLPLSLSGLPVFLLSPLQLDRSLARFRRQIVKVRLQLSFTTRSDFFDVDRAHRPGLANRAPLLRCQPAVLLFGEFHENLVPDAGPVTHDRHR